MKHADLDPVLTTASRLAVAATLADGASWSFTRLRAATGLADGNLHVQTRRLEEAGYVQRRTAHEGQRRVTCFNLTEGGRDALEHHLRLLQRALDTGQEVAPRLRVRQGELGRQRDPSRVW